MFIVNGFSFRTRPIWGRIKTTPESVYKPKIFSGLKKELYYFLYISTWYLVL